MTISTEARGPDHSDYWQEQRGVTISAAVLPGEEARLLGELNKIGIQVNTTGQPFSRSPVIHYARFVFIPGDTDREGITIGPSLMYIADFDGSVERHLDEINDIAAAEFSKLGRFCSEPVPDDAVGRRQWLAAHVIPDATYYVNTLGRTVRQIKDEARLRAVIEEFLDSADLSSESPDGVTERIREHLRSRPEFTWALDPAPSDLAWRVGRTIARIAVIGVAIPAALVLLPVIVVWAIALRKREDLDGGSPPRPDPDRVLRLAAAEDKRLQNQFSALGFVKPGWFRLTTARIILWLGRFGTRYFFDRESIAGVKTIHFARWTFIDKRRRMLFASNYDGSLENYMGDFIDIVAWGLNAIFSNGSEYPKTRWLILDGAWDEGAFKRHIRNRQIETQVWYSAYPNLSAATIAENARIRAALSAPQRRRDGIDWLKLLRRNWGRPADVPVDLEKEDMQGLLVRGYGRHPAASFVRLNVKPGNASREAARAWLGALNVADGASAPGASVVHVAFTARGLRRLGCPAETLAGFSDEFLAGMTTEHRRRILGDDGPSAPEHWDWGGPEQAIDGLLLVYARHEELLQKRLSELEKDLTQHDIVFTRLGTRAIKVGMDGFFREHFGFSDGLTAPRIEGLSATAAQDELVKPGEFFLGYQNEYGRYTERPLVEPARDPGGLLKPDVEGSGLRDLGRNGTYLVFRQLHQDVQGFWSAIDSASAGQPGATASERRIRLAAKMVGRWPGGAPLVLAPEGDDPKLALADFAFHAGDRDGLRCPIGAHIRRTNPRDSLDPQPGTAESLSVSKRHRLLRRGRTYGEPLDRSLDPDRMLAADDAGERGLHFICLVANITRQFEFVQASWVNNPQFAGLLNDVDPLIGRRGRYTHPQPIGTSASFTIPAKPARRRVHNLPDFVTVKGGGYFFMPSISAIRYLAAGPAG